MKKIIGITLIAGTIALAGCSSGRGPAASGGLKVAGQDQAGSASAYGLGNGAGYGEAGGDSSVANNPVCRAANPAGGENQHYFFAFDKSNINPRATQSLQNQANYLNGHHYVKVRVEGNTDDRGSREYNVALGYRRAKAIAAMLQQFGANKKQLVIISYGAEKPAAIGNSDAAYQCNRRVDLKFVS